MARGKRIWEQLTDAPDIAELPLAGKPIVEIAGTNRVLIENHLGICVYGNEEIVIKVGFGSISVCGQGLELMKMDKCQLVIRGQIGCVSLHRGR